jgi:Concanavalin A-like lectin/glucanases superfamily
MTVAVTCAACARLSRVPDSALGQRVRCPYCFDSFTAEATSAVVPEPVEVAAPEAPIQAEPPEPEVVYTGELLPADDLTPAVAAPAHVAATSPVQPFPPIRFVVLITRDPDRALKGRLSAVVAPDGLTLSRADGRVEVRIPIGSVTHYLGLNRLALTVEGREVQMLVFKGSANQDRLARDLAAFLSGQRHALHPHDYARVWYVVMVALLPLGLPVAAWFQRLIAGVVSGVVWLSLAVVLTTLGVVLALRSRRHPGVRFLAVGGIDALGAGVLAGAVMLGLAAAAPIPTRGWQLLRLSGDPHGASVTLPPGPVRSEQHALGQQSFTVWILDLPQSRASFSFGAVDLKGTGLPLNDPDRVFELRKAAILRELPGTMSNPMSPDSVDNLHPGCRLEFLEVGGRPNTFLRVHLYLVRKRLYMLAVSGEDVFAEWRTCSEFFRSFHVSAKPDPRMPGELPGLLAHFSFDEAGGNIAQDHNGRNGILRNADWVRGVRDHGVHFRGNNSQFDYSNIPDLDFAAGQPFTLAGWFRTTAADGVIFAHRSANDETPVLRLAVLRGVLELHGRSSEQRKQPCTILAGQVVNDDRWHHFACTRTAEGEMILYQDGIVQGRTVASVVSGAIKTDMRSVGCDPRGMKLQGVGIQARPFYFTGDVDEFCIFGRALTAVEIAGLASPPGAGR